MKNTLLTAIFLNAMVAGCSGIPSSNGASVAVFEVTDELPAPDFFEYVVHKKSDAAIIRPSVQTVVCVECVNVSKQALGYGVAIWMRIGIKDPWKPTAKVVEEMSETVTHKNFAFDSYELVGNLDPLKKIISFAEQKKEYTISIIGHTDSIGGDDYNLKLGMRRAETVQKWLIAHGIPKQNITVVSKGKNEPIAMNTTAEGRSQNRRAEAKVLVIELVSAPK